MTESYLMAILRDEESGLLSTTTLKFANNLKTLLEAQGYIVCIKKVASGDEL